MAIDIKTTKMFICPCCGGQRRMSDTIVSLPYCAICGTKFIDTHLTISQYLDVASPSLDKQLRQQYVYPNPLYDPEMEKIRETLERGESVPPRLIKCPVCKGQTSSTAENCPHCGQAIAIMMSQPGKVGAAARVAASRPQQPIGPQCPSCGSANIKKIDAFDRVTSIAFWGLASGKIGKQYECRSCRHRW